jgi:hypothetical protein
MNDHEYEYDPAQHNSTQKETYGRTAYTGPGEELIVVKKKQTKEIDHFQSSLSDQLYTDRDLDRAWAEFDHYTRIIIRSWDLMRDPSRTGTLVRFENPKTNQRSVDFKFTLMNRQFQRNLKPNADRVREEIDANIAHMDFYKQGGVRRWSGATASGSIQLIITQIGDNIEYAYLVIADQVFIELTNRWLPIIQGIPRFDYQQAIDLGRTAEQTIAHVRKRA